MILYSNYNLDVDEARQFLFDMYAGENNWESVDDVPDEDAWEQAHHEDEVNWEEFCDELSHFLYGRRWLVMGEVGLWTGKHKAGKIVYSIGELADAWEDCDYIEFSDNGGHLYLKCSHHDGTNSFEIKELNQNGREYADEHWDECDFVVHSFLFERDEYTSIPCYAKKVYGITE